MEAMVRAPLRRRQAETVSTTSAPASAASASQSSAESSGRSSTITSSGSVSAASATSSIVSGATTSANSVYKNVDPPAHTATSHAPYKAIGVNATHSATTSTTHSTSLVSSTTRTSTTSTTSMYQSPAESQIAAAKAFGIPPNQLTACAMGTDPKNGPICSPIQQQHLWAGLTYAITWNPDLMARNATNVFSIDYQDASLGNAWKSDPVPNIQGYVDVETADAWLKGASGNNTDNGRNLTLSLLSTPFGGVENKIPGPELLLVIDPRLVPLPPVKNPVPQKYGLEIGLPVGIVAAILILLGIGCSIRKTNSHHRSIRGVSHDYMARRSRRRGKGADVALQELGQDGYHDQPVSGGTGNAFRDEIAKQRQEDDASIRRFPSSY